MRYYIFRRKDGSDRDGSQKGGGDESSTRIDFGDSSKFYVGRMDDYDSSYSFLNSVHHIMKSHRVIPRNLYVDEMCQDFGIDVVDDAKINSNTLKKISKKLVVEHAVESENEPVLDGLNIFTVERDCNNYYDVDLNRGNRNSKAIILMKEGNLFVPLYQIDSEGKRKGMFRMNDSLVKAMLEDI